MPETTWNTEAARVNAVRRRLAPERVSLVLIALASIAYCAWILSLPLFPTQDGPMHLYYARILQALLFHRNPGLFPQYYVIKSLAPPYALYYYLLLGLGHFVPLIAADKLIVCLYIVLFLFGFRFLARSLGPSGDAVSLLAIPYAFNWPLGMGFVNFCLSLALSCWALGLWCRVAQQPASPRNRRRLIGFAILAWVVMFTHPVPLLFALGFCFIELCARLLRTQNLRDPRFRRDALAFLLAATTLLYVKAFTTSHVAQQVDPTHPTYLGAVRAAIKSIATFSTVDIFAPHYTVLMLFRRASIYLIFLLALGLAAVHAWRSLRDRGWHLADTWFVLALVLWVTVPILPPDMNSSHLFSSRLMIFAVIAALAAASGASIPRLGFERTLLACALQALVLLPVTLILAQQNIAPVAHRLDLLDTLPPLPQGIYLALVNDPYARSVPGLTYDPYWWAQVRPILRSDSILFNTPWLDLPIIPVGAQPVLPTGRMAASDLETAMLLRKTLAQSAQARFILFPPLTGAIIDHAALPLQAGLDPTLQEDPVPTHHWVCAPYAFTTVCSDGVKLDGKAYNREQ